MKLPHYEKAVISKEKLTGYLLSLTHRAGRSKAEFFSAFGFTADAWEMLAEALRRHATHDVTKVEDTPFGIRYTIEGPLDTPTSRRPTIRTVWFIEQGETAPRFVTAYPCQWRR